MGEEDIEGEIDSQLIKPGPMVMTDRVPQSIVPLPAGDRYLHLMEVAIEKGATDQLEKLMALEERWEAKESRKKFYSALSLFQSKIPTIYKKGHAGFDHKNGGGSTEYDFARLEDITAAINPLLADHGLSYRFEREQEDGVISITCIVTHESGHSEKNKMTSLPDASGKKNPIQQIGSADAYMRRYTLTGSFALTFAGEDNDAADYQDQEPEPEFYPDEQFDAAFPEWQRLTNNSTRHFQSGSE